MLHEKKSGTVPALSYLVVGAWGGGCLGRWVSEAVGACSASSRAVSWASRRAASTRTCAGWWVIGVVGAWGGGCLPRNSVQSQKLKQTPQKRKKKKRLTQAQNGTRPKTKRYKHPKRQSKGTCRAIAHDLVVLPPVCLLLLIITTGGFGLYLQSWMLLAILPQLPPLIA